MAKSWKEISESYDFNRAALAKQRLANVRGSGRRVRGARIANLMRAAGIREEEITDEDILQLDEVLSSDAKAGDWIHDFVHSSNPKFEGKSKKERIRMALGAYYHSKRHKDGEGITEESDTVTKDKEGKVTSWKHEGDWKKSDPKKNPEGKVHNLAGMALKKTKEMTKEELVGGQKNLDKNHNNKLDAQDFKILRGKKKVQEGDVCPKCGKSPCECGHMNEGNSHEYADGKMSMHELKQIKAHVDWILEMLKPDTDMPEWVQAKITLAADYLSTACDYLHVELNEGTYSADVERAFPGGKASGVKTHPVAPVPDKKYIKGTPEHAAHKASQKPKTGHPTGNIVDKSGAVHTPMSRARHLARMAMQQQMKEEQYPGLEQEDKPGKIKTAVVKLHPKGVESETVEGWKDTKKPTKESYDEEGNLIIMPKTYQQFMEELLEGQTIQVAPGVRRHIGTYGTAKGAKYGNTDYDRETLDTKDDEGSEEPQKRGRGRPAGSKSGARGPRIK